MHRQAGERRHRRKWKRSHDHAVDGGARRSTSAGVGESRGDWKRLKIALALVIDAPRKNDRAQQAGATDDHSSAAWLLIVDKTVEQQRSVPGGAEHQSIGGIQIGDHATLPSAKAESNQFSDRSL